MSSRTFSFFKEHFSKELLLILIPIFFNLSTTLWSNYRSYSTSNEKKEYERLRSEGDSLLTQAYLQGSELHILNKYTRIHTAIIRNMANRLDKVGKVIDFYNNNEFPNDSSKYYSMSLISSRKVLISDIGALNAYMDINLYEKNSEKKINIDVLKAELDMIDDLIKFTEGKLRKNSVTDRKIAEFYISTQSIISYNKDSLRIEKMYNSGDNDGKKLLIALEDIRNNYRLYRSIYFYGFIMTSLITASLAILTFYLGYFKVSQP